MNSRTAVVCFVIASAVGGAFLFATTPGKCYTTANNVACGTSKPCKPCSLPDGCGIKTSALLISDCVGGSASGSKGCADGGIAPCYNVWTCTETSTPCQGGGYTCTRDPMSTTGTMPTGIKVVNGVQCP